jgi:hypothetical protein
MNLGNLTMQTLTQLILFVGIITLIMWADYLCYQNANKNKTDEK